MSYQKGDMVRLSATFKDLSGAVADPTTVALSVRTPANVTTTYTWAEAQVVKESVGVFYFDLALTAPGVYTYRWLGTGAVQAATPDTTVLVQDTIF